MCRVDRSKPNLTADLARVSGAREKALLTTNPLSVHLSLIHTHTRFTQSVSLCEYVISKHVFLARRARDIGCERKRSDGRKMSAAGTK